MRVDGFSALMVLIVAGIGVLVFAYAARYLPREGAGVGRLVGLLTLFAGAMVGLVVSDNLFFLYTFWELTSVTSYLLIGNDHADARARASALQALLVTSAGGLAMLVGFVLLGQAAGTYRLSEIVASPPSGTTVTVALVLVLVGAMTKSAQYPFHSWLPGRHGGPDPHQRLPPLRHHGHGRRLPRGAPLAGVRLRGALAADGLHASASSRCSRAGSGRSASTT